MRFNTTKSCMDLSKVNFRWIFKNLESKKKNPFCRRRSLVKSIFQRSQFLLLIKITDGRTTNMNVEFWGLPLRFCALESGVQNPTVKNSESQNSFDFVSSLFSNVWYSINNEIWFISYKRWSSKHKERIEELLTQVEPWFYFCRATRLHESLIKLILIIYSKNRSWLVLTYQAFY